MAQKKIPYLYWNQRTITDFSDQNINPLYNQGYLFTRLGKGIMHQTRSLRIDFSKFKLSSENRRVLRKTEALHISVHPLPLSDYSWKIGKLAKDFYDTKFGQGTMSANKVKELLTDPEKSNFTVLLAFTMNNEQLTNNNPVGYAICYENSDLLHYAYPFYDLKPNTYNLISNLGMGMMLRAILYAQEEGKKYIYLGSATRPTDTYKVQFTGLEWWNEADWSTDISTLKIILLEKTNDASYV